MDAPDTVFGFFLLSNKCLKLFFQTGKIKMFLVTNYTSQLTSSRAFARREGLSLQEEWSFVSGPSKLSPLEKAYFRAVFLF